MKDSIKIGTVEMPLHDFVVSRNAILGITKSGKTYTAKGVAEQLMAHGVPIIVFDAIGVWRFLKVPSGNPGGKGFPIVVAGGAQPDLPLNPQTAPAIIRAAIQNNMPLVIDLYDPKLSKADWRRIVQECFRILLYENKGLRHIFLEESAEYAPQKVIDGQTYAEVEKLARMGGNASLGITFINQRAQELNKAVLELCDNIVLLRQRGTHAIDSLEKQMDKLSPDMAKEIALSMPRMNSGDCWIFTERDEIPVRTRSGQIKSFHPDRRNPDARELAGKAVDTGEFVATMKGQLEKVVAEAKENDPAELKKKLAEAKRTIQQLADAKTPKASHPIVIKKVPALTDEERKRLTKAIQIGENILSNTAAVGNLLEENKVLASQLRADLKFFNDLLTDKLLASPQGARVKPPLLLTANRAPVVHRPMPSHRPVSEIRENMNGDMPTGGLRRMLIALAQRPGLSARQLGVRAGLSSSSGSFNTYLSKARTNGWMTGDRNRMEATPDGIAAIGEYKPLPEGKELLEYWLQELGQGGAGRILSALSLSYPRELTKQELGEQTQLSEKSGSFNTYLSKLRTLELISGSNPLKASD